MPVTVVSPNPAVAVDSSELHRRCGVDSRELHRRYRFDATACSVAADGDAACR
jgi:hypothetical protein